MAQIRHHGRTHESDSGRHSLRTDFLFIRFVGINHASAQWPAPSRRLLRVCPTTVEALKAQSAELFSSALRGKDYRFVFDR
jgi:hypothetical protein